MTLIGVFCNTTGCYIMLVSIVYNKTVDFHCWVHRGRIIVSWLCLYTAVWLWLYTWSAACIAPLAGSSRITNTSWSVPWVAKFGWNRVRDDDTMTPTSKSIWRSVLRRTVRPGPHFLYSQTEEKSTGCHRPHYITVVQSVLVDSSSWSGPNFKRNSTRQGAVSSVGSACGRTDRRRRAAVAESIVCVEHIWLR